MLTAEELHERGVGAINSGRLGQARGLLERALDRTTDQHLTGTIEASLAYVEAETGNRDAAMRVCERALARPGLPGPTRGALHSQHALLLMLAGRTPEAKSELDVAIAALEGVPKPLGRAHGNRGNLFLQQNDLAAARADFEAAARLLTEAGIAVEAAMNEHNLGYVRLLGGDLVGALKEMDRARVVLAPLSTVAQATCDQDRAEVLLAAGLLDEGRAALVASSRAYGSRRLRRRQAEVDLVLARSLLFEEPEAALTVARQAERRFTLAEAPAMRSRAAGAVVMAEIELGRRQPRLLAQGRRVAADLDRDGIEWLATTIRLENVRLLLRRDQVDDARAEVASTRVDTGSPLSLRLLDRDVRAELAAAQGRRTNALNHLRAGLADLHAWQSSFGSLDLQTGVAGHGTRLGVRGLALAVGSRKPEVLIEWSERARMLASRVQPVRAPEDESIVADLAELREIAQAREGARRTPPEREAELRQRVRERAWRHRGSGEVADPVTLTELRAALDAETALVAYVVTAERLVALVVTADATTWVDLGERAELDRLTGGLLPDLDVAASDLSDTMAAFVRQELAERLDALAALLVTPVLDAVGERRVVLTPSGVLAGVPWTLLPGFVGRPLTVAQSATSWLARHMTPLRSASAGFVAGRRVARAEDEVTAAAKEWPDARILVGEQTTAAAVSELAASVDVLHIAAHGRHSAENPMFSGLQLVDGPWFGYDIDQLRSVPDIVLLSACEVGRSTVRWGEELIGMTTAWLHAGARCVIASAAAINDRAAYDVLVAVHQQLAAGADPAAALAAAVPAVSSDTAPVPLVCFG
ncbi:MAG: Tetratricopeptide 2 repeat protein [Nocardioides sp.]|nr:Tetratricopeptide 2 repeat protein [Nocardioides sp.]